MYILLWALTHGHNNVGRLKKVYAHQFYADTEYCLADLLRLMDDREGCRESRECMLSVIFDDFIYIYIYIYI